MVEGERSTKRAAAGFTAHKSIVAHRAAKDGNNSILARDEIPVGDVYDRDTNSAIVKVEFSPHRRKESSSLRRSHRNVDKVIDKVDSRVSLVRFSVYVSIVILSIDSTMRKLLSA